jgi:hypothetical protein
VTLWRLRRLCAQRGHQVWRAVDECKCCETYDLTERRCCSKRCSPVCLWASAYNVMQLQSNSTRGIRLGSLFASQGRRVVTATLCVAL